MCEWLQDDQFQRPGDGHGGAQPNLFTTTIRSSSFRAAPRHDIDYRLHNDTTDVAFSATLHSDRDVFPPKDIVDRQSSQPGVIDYVDLDGHVNPQTGDDIGGLEADRPTASGRPAGRATLCCAICRLLMKTHKCALQL